MTTEGVTVVGAGLAGTECAFQLAERGVPVTLVEQKPAKRTPAQSLPGFAELVCSNSVRGAALANAVGLLKEEMRRAGSLVMAAGEVARVPAGGAFAVDRERFSEEVTRRIAAHPRIRVVHEEVLRIPEARPVVIATGPLTGDALAADIAAVVGAEHLAYYDAIAPVVSADSIDWSKVFRASRWGKGEPGEGEGGGGGDDAYVNCPMDRPQYEAFVKALLDAEKVAPREFEQVRYFEGCLPIEVMAERGERTLAFGCMKPVGLVDPRTGKRPYAVVQLRQEDLAATAYNLVGFQTRMKHPEQQRIFRTIPGLENAEFQRLGSVHRNTFVRAPDVLGDDLALLARPGVYLAGQVTGVEGYVESAACGLVLGAELAARVLGREPSSPSPATALGALRGHLRRKVPDFQPSNVVWSMFPPIEDDTFVTKAGKVRKISKEDRRARQVERALAELEGWLDRVGAAPVRAALERG